MRHITQLDEAAELFKALGSDIRIQIIKLLMVHKRMNLNEIATALGITNGALTSHIKKLENAHLITINSESTGHGNQKLCSLCLDKLLIDFEGNESVQNVYNTSLKVGHYSNYKVYPTCGLASSTSIIGEVDDIRYFSHPDRYNADILWFTKGYVEYEIPNFIPAGQRITQIMISAELCSEAPGVNSVWPSDITFSLNGTELGTWTSPGDFGDVRGLFTPEWWYPNWNQYGLLKMIVVNETGTFLDGLQISDVSIHPFALTGKSKLLLRFSVKHDAQHVGGLTIFGSSFGNYAQDIKVSIHYVPEETQDVKDNKGTGK